MHLLFIFVSCISFCHGFHFSFLFLSLVLYCGMLLLLIRFFHGYIFENNFRNEKENEYFVFILFFLNRNEYGDFDFCVSTCLGM